MVQALRIGDMAIATTPTETYAITGLKIKAASPLRHTVVFDLANGGDKAWALDPPYRRLGQAAFEAAGALERLEAFASLNGPDFYGLPRNTDRITLVREDWTAPASLPLGEQTVIPLRAGETLRWRLLENQA